MNLSSNTALTDLSCAGNELRSLDVSGLTELVSLSCEDNNLTYLNTAGLMHLGTVDASAQRIEDLLMLYSETEGVGSWTNVSWQDGAQARTFLSDDITDFYEYSEDTGSYDANSPAAFLKP